MQVSEQEACLILLSKGGKREHPRVIKRGLTDVQAFGFVHHHLKETKGQSFMIAPTYYKKEYKSVPNRNDCEKLLKDFISNIDHYDLSFTIGSLRSHYEENMKDLGVIVKTKTVYGKPNIGSRQLTLF